MTIIQAAAPKTEGSGSGTLTAALERVCGHSTGLLASPSPRWSNDRLNQNETVAVRKHPNNKAGTGARRELHCRLLLVGILELYMR